jgi:hypothetical protein
MEASSLPKGDYYQATIIPRHVDLMPLSDTWYRSCDRSAASNLSSSLEPPHPLETLSTRLRALPLLALRGLSNELLVNISRRTNEQYKALRLLHPALGFEDTEYYPSLRSND